MAPAAATRRATAQSNLRASRTKQAVRLVKKVGEVEPAEIAKLYVPENKLNRLPVEARNEVLKLAQGLIDVAKHGKFDLRQHMRA